MRLLVWAAAFAATSLSHPSLAAPTTSTQLPPYAAAYEPRTVDERGIWMDADETNNDWTAK